MPTEFHGNGHEYHDESGGLEEEGEELDWDYGDR